MPLPRPASPRALWADLRAFAAERSRYQWVSALLAIALPAAILWMFVLDSNGLKPRPRITFVEGWSAARSDDEIRAAQVVRERERVARAEEVRRRWRALGNATGVNR